VADGASLVAKGTVQGIATGDGWAVASRISKGAMSVGTGAGQSVIAVVVGVEDGVYAAGKGIFLEFRRLGRRVVAAVLMNSNSLESGKHHHNKDDKAGKRRGHSTPRQKKR
jgi:hypothetical protein